MLPQITGQIHADFEKGKFCRLNFPLIFNSDKKAIDRMNAEMAKPLKSRDEMIKSLKALFKSSTSIKGNGTGSVERY